MERGSGNARAPAGARALDRTRPARDIHGVFGASHSELALVGMLFLLVLVAPKIPRIGEWIGARFEPGDPSAPRSGRSDAPSSSPSTQPGPPAERDRQPPSR